MTDPLNRLSGDRGPFIHPCEVCGEWGSYGFGRTVETSKWYCKEHRPEWTPYKESQKEMMRGIPTRFAAPCTYCGHELDTRAEGTHQWTSGWVMQRQGGGGHGVSLPRRHNYWAHRQCVERAIKGGPTQATMLFDPPELPPETPEQLKETVKKFL